MPMLACPHVIIMEMLYLWFNGYLSVQTNKLIQADAVTQTVTV